MATQNEQIAASQQRQRIPTEWQVEFLTWSNDSLLSLNEDAIVRPEIRAYAGWELDYRIANAIEVTDPAPPQVERHEYTTAYAERLVK